MEFCDVEDEIMDEGAHSTIVITDRYWMLKKCSLDPLPHPPTITKLRSRMGEEGLLWPSALLVAQGKVLEVREGPLWGCCLDEQAVPGMKQ